MPEPNNGKMTIAAASRDISAADLQVAMPAQRNPNLLGHLVELSRSTFDFYPSHFPCTITYPWVSERIGQLPEGSRVLDIGAGVRMLWLRDTNCARLSRNLNWNKTPSAPKLPREVIEKISAKYREAFRRLTNKQVETR